MIGKAASRLSLSGCLLLLVGILAAAQDAGQVRRVSVGYNTLKNTEKLTPNKRAEVERLGLAAQLANSAGKYGEALKHYYHAISIMRGVEWTPFRAFNSALVVKLDHALAEPGEPVTVRLEHLFPLDEKPQEKLTVSVLLIKMAGDETVKVLKTLDSLDYNPAALQVVVPDAEPGNYRVSVRIQHGAEDPIIKNSTIHIERGLKSRVAAAKKRITDLQDRLKARKQEQLLAALPSAEYRVSLPDMADAGAINFDRIDFGEELKEAAAMLDAIDHGHDPFTARRGDLKKAYRSKVDGTLQPYRIFVPAGYDRSKAYPLVIALHGMGGDENSYFEVYAKGAIKTEAEQRGYIIACPKGRESTSMYLGKAEQDVMDVLAEMRRAYNIDPDRVYMTGHSMGGFGTWSVAANNPTIFAALAPIAGGGNPAIMPRIAHIPQLVVHGDSDPTVPVERSRVMVEAASKSGAMVRYIEIPGGKHGDVVVPSFKDVFSWFDAHRRKSAGAKAAATGATTR